MIAHLSFNQQPNDSDGETKRLTEVADELHVAYDDKSGPSPTLVKAKDIMPDADTLKVLADQVRKVSTTMRQVIAIRSDNPRALAIGLSPLQVDKPWYNYFMPSSLV